MHLTNYAENNLIDRTLRGQAYSPPATHYFALLTSTTGPRQNSHAYSLNDTLSLLATDGEIHLYKVTTAGTSAAGQGALYPGVEDEVIADGTATMTEQSAALDAGTAIVEPAAGGYAREGVVSSMANWLDTQGAGGGVVSTGTSRTISNVAAIDFGSASGADWGFVWGVADFDAATVGNALAWGPLNAAVTISDGDSYSIEAGELDLTFTGAVTSYLANKLFDWLWRGQAFAAPANVYMALMTANGTASVAGTEEAATGYAREVIACSLAAFAGTQAAGSTSASSGSSGTTSPNAATAYAVPAGADWGVITGVEFYDALSAGNRLLFGALTASKTVTGGSGGSTPTWAAGQPQIRIR